MGRAFGIEFTAQIWKEGEQYVAHAFPLAVREWYSGQTHTLDTVVGERPGIGKEWSGEGLGSGSEMARSLRIECPGPTTT